VSIAFSYSHSIVFNMSMAEFDGDRPIRTDDEDRFGFSSLADRIADALTVQPGSKGFVFGLEGKWGSGKSSLLALSLKKLRAMDTGKVAAVEFRPWLIGDRDQLLNSLFEELAKAIAGLEREGGDATRATTLAAKDVAAQVKSFARHLGPVGKLAGVAGLFVPGATIAGDIIEKIAAAAAEQTEGPTLVEQKERLSASLLKLDCRIVVTIDDVDRLEPKEIAELLRLVRSVADFPNVSYLLCYDRRILAHAIEAGMGLPNGNNYLEKIIQTAVAVPQPESFALRRWFSTQLQGFAQGRQDRVSQLQQVIDQTGGRVMGTPRAVVRVLDSLRVYWPSLQSRVDLADLVWLRMIAVGHPNLYGWIEEYLVASVALSSGRVVVSSDQQAEMGKGLNAALAADGLEWDKIQFELERHLPGIQTQAFNKKKDERLFYQLKKGRYGGRSNDGLLANPSYTRLFFTLIDSPDAVTEDDVQRLLTAANASAENVKYLIVSMGLQKGDAGASKAERLLDEFRYTDREVYSTWPLEALVMGLSEAADDLAAVGIDDWGYPQVWYLLRAVLRQLHDGVEPERFQRLFRLLFTNGTSLGFLTYLLRDETFNQGFFGDRGNVHECLASAQTFEEIRIGMLRRYDAMGLDGVLNHQAATNILYAWSQAGGRDDLKSRIEARAQSDGWLLTFVSKLYSVNSSLSLDALSAFFKQPSKIVKRLSQLAQGDPPVAAAEAAIRSLKSNMRFDGEDLDALMATWQQHEADQTG
jgi:hypothetical protein